MDMDSSPRRDQAATPRLLQLAFGGVGGTTNVALAIADGMHRRGWACSLIRYADRSDLLQGDKVWPSRFTTHTFERNGRIDPRSLRSVYRVVRTERPSIVLAHNHALVPAALAAYLSMGRKPRLVLVEHQSNSLRTRGNDARSLVGLMCSQASVLLTPQAWETYPLRRAPLSAVRSAQVISTGVDLGIFGRKTTASPEPPHRFVTASRLVPPKNVDQLIRIIAAFNEGSEQKATLHIAGDGPERQKLERLATEIAAPSVEFLGLLDASELASLMASATAYVHASDGETLSTSLLQALASGTPIVTTGVPGVVDVLPSDAALFVRPDDVLGFVEQLQTLVTDSSVWAGLSARGVELAKNRYSLKVMIDAYEKLFLSLL